MQCSSKGEYQNAQNYDRLRIYILFYSSVLWGRLPATKHSNQLELLCVFSALFLANFGPDNFISEEV